MSTPTAFAITSQNRLCQAALATAAIPARRIDFIERKRFMDLSIVHLHKAVAALGKTAIVRGHQQGDALGGHKIKQEIEDHAAGCFIERASRFVGKQDLRFVHQRAAERRTLAFSAGEFLDAMVEAVAEPGTLRKVQQARLCCAPIDTGGNGGDKAVFCEGQIGDEVVKLKDKTDFASQKLQEIAAAVDLDTVDHTLPRSGKSNPANR